MEHSKSLYSRCFDEYKLTDEQLKKLQDALLGMLVDVMAVCDKYGIDCMLAYGTTLGAVRHRGFIPWDDDVDVMMLRSEFERFREVFRSEFPGKYELDEPLSDPRYVSKIVKIFKKGTSFVELPAAGVGGPDMIFIDLFLIENVPAPGIGRKLVKLAYETAFKAASLCVDYRYPSPPIMEKCRTDPELKKYYRTRRLLGFFPATLGGMSFYLKICEKLADRKKKSGWLGIPGDGNYTEAIYPAGIYTETATAEFCGYQMKIPKDYDTYLRQLYGDYMQIPPPEKQEYHSAYKFSL